MTKQVDAIKRLWDEYQEIRQPHTEEKFIRQQQPVDGEKLKQAVEEIAHNLLGDLKKKYEEADYEICTGFDSAQTASVKRAIDEADRRFSLNDRDSKLYLDIILERIVNYP